MEFTHKFTSYVSPLIAKYGALSKTAIPASIHLHHSSTYATHKQETTPLSTSPPSLSSPLRSKLAQYSRKNFYELLGLSKNCSDYEIRTAYKKLAMQYHPDHNPSPDCEEHFQVLTNAYEILCDPDKRKKYDMELNINSFHLRDVLSSSTAKKCTEKLFNDDENTTLSQIRIPKSAHLPQQLFNPKLPETETDSKDIKHTVLVSLEELYLGKRKKFNVERLRLCTTCGGKGVSEKENSCTSCNGKGFTMKGISYQHLMKHKCMACTGVGAFVQSYKCSSCGGGKRIPSSNVYRIHIKPGMLSGEDIIFPGEGDEYHAATSSVPTVEKGDLIFTLSQKPHKVFTRSGDHLFVRHSLSVTEALSGKVEFNLVHLDGRILQIRYNNSEKGCVVMNNQFKCVKNQGMPMQSPTAKKQYGDLFIQFLVDSSAAESYRFSDLIPTSLLASTSSPKCELKVQQADLTDVSNEEFLNQILPESYKIK